MDGERQLIGTTPCISQSTARRPQPAGYYDRPSPAPASMPEHFCHKGADFWGRRAGRCALAEALRQIPKLSAACIAPGRAVLRARCVERPGTLISGQ